MSYPRINHYPLPEELAIEFASFIESEHTLTVPAKDDVVLLDSSYSCQRLELSVSIDSDQATTMRLAAGLPLQVRNIRTGALPVFDSPVPYVRYRPNNPKSDLDDWRVEAPGLRINNWNDFEYMSEILGGCVLKKLSVINGLSVHTHA